MILPRGHRFNSVFDGVSYEFVVTESVASKSINDFNYKSIEIVQGTYVTDTFIYDTQIQNCQNLYCQMQESIEIL